MGLYFTICSFVYICIFIIFFFLKGSVDTTETKTYKVLLISTAIGLFFDAFSAFVYQYNNNMVDSLMYRLSAKMVFVYFIAWISSFTYYIFTSSYSSNLLSPTETKAYFKKVYKKFLLAFVVLSIIIMITPLEFIQTKNSLYPNGLSVNLTYTFVAIYMIAIIYLTIKYRKQLINKKYTPLFALIVSIILTALIQKLIPDLFLINFFLSIIVIIMYFTIENPDLKMLEQLYNSKEIAEKANSNKSIFMFNVVQRIRGPIKSIKRIGEEALTMKKEEDLKEGISIIMDETKSMENFVNEVLDISAIDTSKLKVFDNEYNIVALLNQVKSQFNLKLKESKKDLSFRENIEKDLPLHLYGDSIKIKQVLNTILCNSLKYTEKGFIELRVTSVIKRDICRLVITVEDSGIGMPINKISTIFENFDDEINIEKVEAEDMNLPIVKKLVDFIGGNIMIESSERKGTTVTVVIDQKIRESNTETIKDLNKKYNTDMFENKKKILLVDDKESNYEFIKRFESEYGIEVIKATTSSETYKIIREQNIELILISSNFKDMSCVDLLQRIKLSDNYKNSVVVICETHQTPEYLRVGFNDNLNTPLTKEKLKRILKKYLDI